MNELLKQLRTQRGLSVQEVATILGITVRAVYNYEQGIREPSIDTLKKLCDLYDVSADYLIGRSEY